VPKFKKKLHRYAITTRGFTLEIESGRDQVRDKAELSKKGQGKISAEETKGNQTEGHQIRSMRNARDPSGLVSGVEGMPHIHH